MGIDEDRLLEMLEAGRTVPEIAKAFGRAKSTIWHHIAKMEKKLGRTLPVRSGRKRPALLTDKQRQALELFDKHGSIAAVAKEMGVCWMTAKKHVVKGRKNAEGLGQDK